jgi:hypothetical protein
VRRLTYSEMSKRGCLYCADCECGSGQHTECHHEKCPYHELDDVKNYGEYILKSNESGLARALANLTKE